MKEYWQTLIEFIVMSITVFGMIYIEVIVYWVVLFKEFLCNC